MSNMSFINRNIPHLPAHPYQLRLAYISYVLKKLLHITFVCKIQVAYAHMHICTYAHMHIRTYAHMHICTYAHIHICTYAHMHICTYAHMHISAYAHIHICTFSVSLPHTLVVMLHESSSLLLTNPLRP